LVAANLGFNDCLDKSDGISNKCKFHACINGMDAELVVDGNRPDGSNSIASSGFVSIVWNFEYGTSLRTLWRQVYILVFGWIFIGTCIRKIGIAQTIFTEFGDDYWKFCEKDNLGFYGGLMVYQHVDFEHSHYINDVSNCAGCIEFV
jgi:hypothetical protein